jgi:putative colanic acid biosynthesis acetyltransferase WcaF
MTPIITETRPLDARANAPALESLEAGSIQDLKSFRLPANFRGRPAWLVQLWWVVQGTLFRMSPQGFYTWRRFLLRLFGCRVGKGALIRPTVEITYPWKVAIGDYSWIGHDVCLYSLGEIHIGDNVVISQKSYLCTGSHDVRSPGFDMRVEPIFVDAEAWIAADVFIFPGVHIGRGTVVGARSTVQEDLPAMMICAGNPAKGISPRFMSEQK